MQNTSRVTKVLLLLAGFIVVLCVGMVIGGAVVYGVTQIGSILPDLRSGPREIQVEKLIEEARIIEEADERPAPVDMLGAYVVQVEPDSPAEQAGLEAGDRILAVDGQRLRVDDNLAELIGSHEPGDRVTLEVRRPGEGFEEIRVRLGEHPEKAGLAWLGIRYSQSGPFGLQEGAPEPLGRFRDFAPEQLPDLFPDLDATQGAVILDVAEDSPAAGAGLESGDVIVAIDGEPVARAEDLSESIAAHQPGDRVTLTIMSMGDGEQREVQVRLAEHPDEPGSGYLGVFLGGGFRFERRRGLLEDDQSWNWYPLQLQLSPWWGRQWWVVPVQCAAARGG